MSSSHSRKYAINSWPKPEQPGFPADPLKSGPHAFRQLHGETAGLEFPVWWDALTKTWTLRGGTRITPEGASIGFYVGPCLLPTQTALKVAEARDDGFEQSREVIRKLRAALQEIVDRHIPDQPAAVDVDELTWAKMHVEKLCGIAAKALKEIPNDL